MAIIIYRLICFLIITSWVLGMVRSLPIEWRKSQESQLSAGGHISDINWHRDLILREYSELLEARDLDLDDLEELLAREYLEPIDEYQVIERRSIFDNIRNFFSNIGHKIKEGFQNFGNKVREGFHKVGEAFHTAGQKIKEGFQKVGEGIKHVVNKVKEGFHTAGEKIKEGFHKAGAWLKDTGAKIVKFGLKVGATIHAVVGHIVRFIPVIGQPLSMAFKASSEGLNRASEAIHANLGSKLEKGMKIMDIVRDPIGHLVKMAANKAAPTLGHVAEKMHIPQAVARVNSAAHQAVSHITSKPAFHQAMSHAGLPAMKARVQAPLKAPSHPAPAPHAAFHAAPHPVPHAAPHPAPHPVAAHHK